jgi:hypothetical protein
MLDYKNVGTKRFTLPKRAEMYTLISFFSAQIYLALCVIGSYPLPNVAI